VISRPGLPKFSYATAPDSSSLAYSPYRLRYLGCLGRFKLRPINFIIIVIIIIIITIIIIIYPFTLAKLVAWSGLRMPIVGWGSRMSAFGNVVEGLFSNSSVLVYCERLTKPFLYSDIWKLPLSTPRRQVILNLGTRWMWVVNFTPRSSYHRANTPVPIEYEAVWSPEPVSTFGDERNCCLYRDSNPCPFSP
jgi:hypothetical protein